MIAALSQALARRGARERLLLAVLLLAVLPAAAVMLGALPLIDHRTAARAALAEAEAERGWYRERQAEIAALPVAGEGDGAPRIAPVGLAGIEARLIDAGLRAAVTRLADAPGDGVALDFDAVRFEALMQWLEGVEAEAGYSVAALRLVRAGDAGQVEAELRLEPLR